MSQKFFNKYGRDGIRELKIELANPNVQTDKINKALKQTDDSVRELAISHPKTASLIDNYLRDFRNDDSVHNRIAAIKNPKATSEHIDKALDDPDEVVREAAIMHPNANKENIHKVLRYDGVAEIRKLALQHPNVHRENILLAIKDKNKDVADTAMRMFKQGKYKK